MIKFVRTFEALVHKLGVTSGLMTLFVMLLVVIDVAGRFLFNSPLPGAEEVAILLLVAKIYISMGTAQQDGQNFEVDLLTRNLPPGAFRVVRAITTSIAVAVVGFLAYLTADLAWTSMVENEVAYSRIPFPIWPSRILIAFGLTCLALQFLIDLFRLIGLLPPRGQSGGPGGTY